MTDRPVNCSREQVIALLAGTCTRISRVIKPRDLAPVDFRGRTAPLHGDAAQIAHRLEQHDPASRTSQHQTYLCPYGKAGDRLWVRESFRSWTLTSHDPNSLDEVDHDSYQLYVAYRATPRQGFRAKPDRVTITYVEDGAPIDPQYQPNLVGPWRRSTQMPSHASRIWLEVTHVEVQRLHDVTEDQAQAEAVQPFVLLRKGYPSKHAADIETLSYREGLYQAWQRTSQGRLTWQRNPWLWAATVRRIDVPDTVYTAQAMLRSNRLEETSA